MARMAAFRFTAIDDAALTEEVRRHIGARRFAYNRCLETVKDKLGERRVRADVEVPWSRYSLINWWNHWKRSEDAGCLFAVDPSGGAELVDQGNGVRVVFGEHLIQGCVREGKICDRTLQGRQC